MHVKTFMSGTSRKRVMREKQIAERSLNKSKRRVIFVALGLALVAAVAWLAVLRDTERPGRAAAREAPTASTSSAVTSASNVGTRTTPNEASGRVMAEGAGANHTESVAVSPRPPSVPVTESPSNATTDTALPVRRASDSGRAQPVFIGLRAPQTARVGEPFRVDEMGCTDRGDVDLESRMLADEHSGGPGVVEVDVRQEQVAEVGQLEPARTQLPLERADARRGAAVEQGRAVVGLQ